MGRETRAAGADVPGRPLPCTGTLAYPRAPRAVGVDAEQPGEMESRRRDLLAQPGEDLQRVEREACSAAHRMNPPALVAGPGSASFKCRGGTGDELEKVQFWPPEQAFRWSGDGWRMAARC